MAVLVECPVCRKKQSLKNRLCSCGENLDRARRSLRARYWISYRLPDGRQRRESVGAMQGLSGNSLSDARAALAKRLAQKRENRVLDLLPENKTTFSELASWYLGLESVRVLKSYKTVCTYLGKFLTEFGEKPVANLRLADLEGLQIKRRASGLKPKTIDAEILYVKSMVMKAIDNDMLSADVVKPFRRVKRLLRVGSNRRQRFVSADEIEKLLRVSPPHLRACLLLGYWTGMRKGEILRLTWSQVDLRGRMIRLSADDTKEGRPKSIPLAAPVVEWLRSIPQGLPGVHVILYNGKPITRNFSAGLKVACKKAGILWGRDVPGGFIFHDLRHSFITDMRRGGVDRSVRMSITGHAISDMDMRYDVVSDRDKLQAIHLLEKYRSSFFWAVDQVLTKELNLKSVDQTLTRMLKK